MMPTPPSRTGRRPHFDREAVTEAVADLFWALGYDGVSLSDIMAATNLSKSSLYNSFGDKDALFRAALSHYGETVVQSGAAWLGADDGSDPLSKLDQLLSGPIDAAHGDGDLRGCFLCNTAADGHSDIAQVDQLLGSGFSALEEGLFALLRRYRPRAPRALLRRYARMSLSVYMGLNVRSRVKPPRAEMNDVKTALLESLKMVLQEQ